MFDAKNLSLVGLYLVYQGHHGWGTSVLVLAYIVAWFEEKA